MLSLLPKLKKDFSGVSFKVADRFSWSPDDNTVFYNKKDDNAPLLLHELAHGLLEHHDYSKDVELLAMESQAWDRAVELASSYDINIDDDTVQDNLDTYREWLHARSTCPRCEATGYQTGKQAYSCVACGHKWRVNEARLCGLKRYSSN